MAGVEDVEATVREDDAGAGLAEDAAEGGDVGLGDEHMGKAPFGGREDLFAVAAFVVVIGVIVSMRFAVEFEDEAMFVADEINDVRANGLLPLEFPRRCS